MKVNYKSDFELTIQLTAGGVDVAAPSWDWQLRFYTFDRQAVYTVAYIDGKAERCAVNSDGTITAYFDKHGLMPGVLRCEFVNLVPDSHYTHDTQMQVDPVELGVELWRGASDGGMDAVTLELAGQVLAEVQALAADLQQKAESGYFDGEPGPQGPQGPPGPAGPGLLVVTVTGSDQEALTADHTAAEILAAHDAGRPVVAMYGGEVYQLASVSASLASFSLASADLEVLAQIDVDGDGHAVRIFDEVQGVLTAGDGINIDGNVISATGGGGSGIESIEQTVTSDESGGINVVTITMSDSRTADFEVMNGKKGDKGDQGPKGDSGVDLGEVVLVNDLTTGGEGNALSAEQGKELKGMIDNIDFTLKYGTYAEALEAVLASNSVFEWLLVDEVDNSDLIKPLWHINGSLVDAAGAVVSLATLTAPTFSIDSGDVYVGTTVTITCPSGSTLYYSVNGVVDTDTSDVTITINEASVVKAYLKSGDAVSDIVAKSYGIAIDHKFQFKIKLTGDNSTEYVPVVATGTPKYTMTVDWGDGTTNEYSDQKFSSKGCGHTYSGTAGDEFTITLRGSAIPNLAFNNGNMCNQSALVAVLDNTLECDTLFGFRSDQSGGFGSCTSLTYLSSNALQNATDSIIEFYGATALTSFEDGFFANIKNITSCKSMFRGLGATITASQMLEIKSMIKNCTNFYYMFYSFSGTAAIPDTFFDEVAAGSVTTVQNFTNASSTVTGDAYALYSVLSTKVTQSAATGSCFKGGGFTNKDQVPSGWK